MNLENMIIVRSGTQKDTLYAIYMKCPQWANPETKSRLVIAKDVAKHLPTTKNNPIQKVSGVPRLKNPVLSLIY